MTTRWDVLSPRAKKDGGTHWHRVGTAFQGAKGINIVFDSLPLPDAEGRVSVSLFEPRESGRSSNATASSQVVPADLGDEVPF